VVKDKVVDCLMCVALLYWGIMWALFSLTCTIVLFLAGFNKDCIQAFDSFVCSITETYRVVSLILRKGLVTADIEMGGSA